MNIGLPLSGISTLFYGVLLLGIIVHKAWACGRSWTRRILVALGRIRVRLPLSGSLGNGGNGRR